MPPRRAAPAKSKSASTTTTAKSQSRKKRTRGKRGEFESEEDEKDEEEETKSDDEESEPPTTASRAKKKTKREEVAAAPSSPSASRIAAAASTSAAIAHLAERTNVTLKCDSDSLSLVFCFLTTHELTVVARVDHRWCNVSRMKTSWPRCYHYESAIAMYHHRQSELQPNGIIANQQHRQVKLTRRFDEMITSSVAKNLHSLYTNMDATHRSKLTASNFPHLTELEYEACSTYSSWGPSLIVDPSTEDAPLSLAPQLHVLKLPNYDMDHEPTKSPFLITPRVLMTFTRIEVLVMGSSIADEYLLSLHHLRHFHLERSKLSTIRIVRYLSIVHALRSFRIRHTNAVSMRMLTTLSWSDTLAVESNHVRGRSYGFGFTTAPVPPPPYVDPIPQGDDAINTLLAKSTHAELHEFETELIAHENLSMVMKMPLRRLTCGVNSPSINARIKIAPTVELFPDSIIATLQLMQHLDLTFDGIQTNLQSLSKCQQLLSLRLVFKSTRPWANRDFSDWLPSLTQLEDLTLEFEHQTPTTVRLAETTWNAIGELVSLRRLDLKLSVDHPFPLELLAENLASLPQFNRLDLRLTCVDHTFTIPVSFLVSVASSSSWRLFHFTVSSLYKLLVESKNTDLKRLTAEQLLSDSIQKFRVFRHHRLAKVSTSSAQTSVTANNRSKVEITQHRIGVKETKSATAKFQPYWICVDEED